MDETGKRLGIDLRQAIGALADALDSVGIDDLYHGKRVGCMARACGQVLGLEATESESLLREGLLHDIGVSSTRLHRSLVREIDWHGAETHCQTGEYLLARCPPLAEHAAVVRYHHTHWPRLASHDLEEEVKTRANLIFLADRADALIAQHGGQTPFDAREMVRVYLPRFSGSLFRPDLVEAFLAASDSEAFWLALEPPFLLNWLEQWMRLDGEAEILEPDLLRAIACLFSHCVDAKSPFTAEHSTGVARLARWLGERAGLDEPTCDRLEIAGLMHDIGKLRVPDEVLEKPGPLNRKERAAMKRHSFDSLRILGGIGGLEEIAQWASQHHEKLDGSGYPFRQDRSQLSLPARVLTVADIFQALAQHRPYRKTLPAATIVSILRAMAKEGKIDPDLVGLVIAQADTCWELALHGADLCSGFRPPPGGPRTPGS